MINENKIYCIDEHVYSEHITKRKEYFIEESNSDKGQVRIRNNQEKLVWIPNSCFDTIMPPEIIAINIDDEIKDSTKDCIEVTIELSSGKKYWLTFITADYIKFLLISQKYLTLQNFIIVEDLNVEIINKAIFELDKTNELTEILNLYDF